MKKNKKRKPHRSVRWTPFQNAELPPGTLSVRERPPVAIFVNNLYQVCMYEWETPMGQVTQLSIRRQDRAPIGDWRHMQRIKNELLGKDIEAVELHPSEGRLVDTANQSHLWALPRGMYFPFGYSERLVAEDVAPPAVQRPWDPDVRPKDLASLEQQEVLKAERLAKLAKAEEE